MNKSNTINFDKIDLIALYEETIKMPIEQRITDWFGDYNMYEIKYGIDDVTLNKRFDEALKATGYTYSQFCNTPFITNKNKFKHLIERNTNENSIKKNSIEQYAESFKKTPVTESDVEYED